jgi:hypothetical protein
MIARAWHGATACLRFCWRLYLWGLGTWAVTCGAGWLVGSLLAHHALSADEWQAFMERLPVIGGL